MALSSRGATTLTVAHGSRLLTRIGFFNELAFFLSNISLRDRVQDDHFPPAAACCTASEVFGVCDAPPKVHSVFVDFCRGSPGAVIVTCWPCGGLASVCDGVESSGLGLLAFPSAACADARVGACSATPSSRTTFASLPLLSAPRFPTALLHPPYARPCQRVCLQSAVVDAPLAHGRRRGHHRRRFHRINQFLRPRFLSATPRRHPVALRRRAWYPRASQFASIDLLPHRSASRAESLHATACPPPSRRCPGGPLSSPFFRAAMLLSMPPPAAHCG